jgi:hypothetical protein
MISDPMAQAEDSQTGSCPVDTLSADGAHPISSDFNSCALSTKVVTRARCLQRVCSENWLDGWHCMHVH